MAHILLNQDMMLLDCKCVEVLKQYSTVACYYKISKPHLFLAIEFSIFNSDKETTVLGRVVQKLINTNPGLKVNRSNNFSSIEMFFTAYVLCGLRSLKLKTEGQKILTANLTENVQK